MRYEVKKEQVVQFYLEEDGEDIDIRVHYSNYSNGHDEVVAFFRDGKLMIMRNLSYLLGFHLDRDGAIRVEKM